MLAAGPFGLGFPELIIILVVVLLIFGASRLADVGGALGKSIREFRRAAREPEEAESGTPEAPVQDSPAADFGGTELHCAKCGASVEGHGKFCANCGAPVQAAVN